MNQRKTRPQFFEGEHGNILSTKWNVSPDISEQRADYLRVGGTKRNVSPDISVQSVLEGRWPACDTVAWTDLGSLASPWPGQDAHCASWLRFCAPYSVI